VGKTFFTLTLFFWALSCRMVNISNDLLEIRTAQHILESGGSLVFDNTNGDLCLSEWSNDYIQVETMIYGDSARGIPEGLQIVIQELGEALTYTVEYPGGLSYVSVDFEVKVPANSRYCLRTVTVNGETVVDADLAAYIESVNGDITAKVLSSNGLITVNGDITAYLEHQIEDLEIETINGDISVELPEELGLVLETMNGNISINGSSYDNSVGITGESDFSAKVETLNGDIDIKQLD